MWSLVPVASGSLFRKELLVMRVWYQLPYIWLQGAKREVEEGREEMGL